MNWLTCFAQTIVSSNFNSSTVPRICHSQSSFLTQLACSMIMPTHLGKIYCTSRVRYSNCHSSYCTSRSVANFTFISQNILRLNRLCCCGLPNWFDWVTSFLTRYINIIWIEIYETFPILFSYTILTWQP